MANQVIGVDLGAYSVKVAVSSPGFRQSTVSRVVEERVPDGEGPHLIRAIAVAGRILQDLIQEDDSVYVAISGDKVFLHVLEFGFKTLRRPDLERAVGAELEGVLPIDLEDMVYAFEPIPKLPEAPVPEDEAAAEPVFVEEADTIVGAPAKRPARGLVAEPAMGMRVLAAATQRSRAEELLVALRHEGTEAQGLLAAPAPYARLLEKITNLDSETGPVAVIDIGHLRMDLCVAMGGRPIFARSLARGGHQLTQLIASTWNLAYEKAEDVKHQSGVVVSRKYPASRETDARMSQLLQTQLRNWVRDIRRTLNACRAKTGFDPVKLFLVGGGSRLAGLDAYLSQELDLETKTVNAEVTRAILGDAADYAPLDVSALAFGVALDGSSARPSFDLRQGPLAYKADLSFLRTKLKSVGIAAGALLAFATLNAWAGVSKLNSAQEILDRRIALESMEAFGEQLSASEVLDRVGPISKKKVVNPMPAMTAYDILLAFNEALPEKDKAVLDVDEIDITPQKLVIKALSSPIGETKALQGIKNLETSLRESACFNDFVSPESQTKGEGRSFSLTINLGKAECH